MGCAIWGEQLKLSIDERDAIETAALLHDVGKLVAPNRVLHKPGPLTESERLLLENCRKTGIELVREQIEMPTVSEIISLAHAWYDGSHQRNGARADTLPLGARMLSIIDALDAMTTSQAYRPALSLADALAELERFSGKQFDPVLVHHLCSLPHSELEFLYQALQREWSFIESSGDAALSLPGLLGETPSHTSLPLELFHEHMLEHLREAVVFVDTSLRIVLWNRGAERLTGIPAARATGRHWTPEFVGMRDGRGSRLQNDDCPARFALSHEQPWLRRVLLKGCDGNHVAVDLRVVPVVERGQKLVGATLLIHDLSSEITLREQCASLQQMMARDALTQVANRAEFDRAHQLAVARASERREPYSLILCDIDHFKKINDNFGHQAGDEVLRGFGKLLSQLCRREDLVARYGGEEFAIVCPDCNLEGARRRAESIRNAVASATQPVLQGQFITASFGVTQHEPGDTGEQMIARADRALYQAKADGRNCVVTLGEQPRRGPLATDDVLLSQVYLSEAPRSVVFEKLRGFVDEYQAEIETAQENYVRLRLDVTACEPRRRATDRSLLCCLDLRIEPLSTSANEDLPASARTRLMLSISTARSRDRRRGDLQPLVRQAVACFRSHMMVLSDAPAA